MECGDPSPAGADVAAFAASWRRAGVVHCFSWEMAGASGPAISVLGIFRSLGPTTLDASVERGINPEVCPDRALDLDGFLFNPFRFIIITLPRMTTGPPSPVTWAC